jgi:hypothetical protein
MKSLPNITSAGQAATSTSMASTHHFATPNVHEVPRPSAEPRSFASVW